MEANQALNNDLICAIATPPGQGGVGIVRLSGKGAGEVAAQLCAKPLQSRTAVYTDFFDAQELLDNGLALWFPGPNSFTDPAVISSESMLSLMAGDLSEVNLQPISLVYSGHQFGVWAGQLGDGRAMTLGELEVKNTNSGETQLWDIQLKGAGTTPYSRFADGRAVLRSSIREYLCSEAMHGLGIASTRALCLVDSKTPVYREEVESAATLCRVARSHIRFGSFEHFHYRNQPDAAKNLADYVISRHFPDWVGEDDRYGNLITHTVTATAKMIAQWQAVGFSHGVMNTDNMSILGDTIDYGPFGFLDVYDPDFICNHSDTNGRYSFKNQPSVGLWNLNALATSLMSLIPSELLVDALKTYEPTFLRVYRELMSTKLGLENIATLMRPLINNLLALMAENQVDYTLGQMF